MYVQHLFEFHPGFQFLDFATSVLGQDISMMYCSSQV